jgi:hypothetical protein
VGNQGAVKVQMDKLWAGVERFLSAPDQQQSAPLLENDYHWPFKSDEVN